MTYIINSAQTSSSFFREGVSKTGPAGSGGSRGPSAPQFPTIQSKIVILWGLLYPPVPSTAPPRPSPLSTHRCPPSPIPGCWQCWGYSPHQSQPFWPISFIFSPSPFSLKFWQTTAQPCPSHPAIPGSLLQASSPELWGKFCEWVPACSLLPSVCSPPASISPSLSSPGSFWSTLSTLSSTCSYQSYLSEIQSPQSSCGESECSISSALPQLTPKMQYFPFVAAQSNAASLSLLSTFPPLYCCTSSVLLWASFQPRQNRQSDQCSLLLTFIRGMPTLSLFCEEPYFPPFCCSFVDL